MSNPSDVFRAESKIRQARAIAFLISCADELPHEMSDELALAGGVVCHLLDEAIRLTDDEEPEEVGPPAGDGKSVKIVKRAG